MNINEELFRRYGAEKKMKMVMELTEDEVLATTAATVTRIIKEVGVSRYERSRDKVLGIPVGIRTGNRWNSTFESVMLSRGKLYVALYIQYSNTDTNDSEYYDKFFSSVDYRGSICYEDRHGNPQTEYYTYTRRDKAKAMRAILITYLDRKYNSKKS